MKHRVFLAALLGVATASGTASAQLSNGGFESGTLAPWVQFGGGNGVVSGNYFGMTASEGTRFWAAVMSYGSTNGNLWGVYQTVNLPAGNYTLTGYVQAHNRTDGFVYRPGEASSNPADTVARIAVDLAGGTDPNVLSVWAPFQNTGAAWAQQQIDFTVTTPGNVTIFCMTRSNWNFAGNWHGFDDIVLVSNSCTNPSTVTLCTPAQIQVPPNPGTQLLMIDGSALDLASGVELTGPATIPGSIVTQTASQITANFDLSTAPPGAYNVVAKRTDPPCTDSRLSNGFQLRCVTPGGSVSPGSVAVPPYPNAQSLSFFGSGLGSDVVTGVRLIHPNKTMVGTITFQSPTQLDATFDMTDAPTGFYNVVFTPVGYNGGCTQETTWWEAFLIDCSAPNTEVTYLVNGAGRSGNAAHKLRLGGVEVDKINSVTLIKNQNNDVAAPIVGTNLHMEGAEMEATFDLSGAEGGYYDIQITRTAHECAIITTPTLTRGFLVYMAPLANASFEEGYKPDTNPPPCQPNPGVNPKAKHWDMSRAPQTGGHKRDGLFGGPGCDPLITGLHFDGIDVSHNTASQDVAIMQAVDISGFLDGSGSVTQDITVQADFALYGGSTPVTGYIRLLAFTDAMIGPAGLIEMAYTELPREADSGEFRSDPLYAAAIPASTVWPQTSPAVMVIELGMVKPDTSPNALPTALWVDNVRMTSLGPACNTPPQDVDGDGDVDLVDFGVFQTCFNGPNRAYSGPPDVQGKCACLDADDAGSDGDVDLTDFSKFQSCFNGPNRPPAC